MYQSRPLYIAIVGRWRLDGVTSQVLVVKLPAPLPHLTPPPSNGAGMVGMA